MRLAANILILLSVIWVKAQVADLPFSNGAVIRYEGDSTRLVTFDIPPGGGINGGVGLVHINCEGYFEKNIGSYAISNDSALNFRRVPNSTICDTALTDIIYSADRTNHKDFHTIRASGAVAGNNTWLFTYAKLRGQGDSIEYLRSDCHGITDTISSTNRERNTLSGNTLIIQDTSQWLYVALGDNFLTFKVNSSGIVKYGRTQGVGTNQNFTGSNYSSQKASHDAEQVALIRERGSDMLTLFNFDKNTGKLTNPKTVLRKNDLPNYNFCIGNRKSNLTGLAFSENDSLIYVVYRYFPNCANINQLYQVIYQLKRFDPYPYLTKKVVHSTLLYKPSAFYKDIFMELGPDGNIYFGEHFDSTIHRISNTNVYGGASVSYDVFELASGDQLGYPTSYLPSAYQRASFDAFTSCQDDTVRAVFYGSDDIQLVTYYWGDGDSTVYNLGQLQNGSLATHVYDSSGTYTIQQTAMYNSCGFTRTKKRTVNYNKPPKSVQYKIALDTFCDWVDLTLSDSLVHTTQVVIHWGDGSVDSVFSTQNNLLLNLKHTYATQDTFTISYQLLGFAADTAAQNGCIVQFDTSLAMAFHPTPTSIWQWYSEAGNYADSGFTTLCFGDSAFLKQENSSFHHFYQSTDTVLQISSLPYLATASDSLFLTSATLKGCTATDTLLVSVLPKPLITRLSDSVFCQNQLPVSLQFSAQSAETTDSIFKMQASGNGISNLVNKDSIQLIIQRVGTFPVSAIATTVFGCADTLNFNCTIHPNIQITVADTTSVCENDSMQMNVIVQTPHIAHLYWTANNTSLDSAIVLSSQNNAKLAALLLSSYHNVQSEITISDINGCKDTAYSTLQIKESPKITFATDSRFFCENDSIRVPVFVQSNVDYSFNTWLNLQALLSTNATTLQDSFVLKPSVGAGLHTLLASASNILGCSASDSTTLIVWPNPQYTIAAEDICEDDSLSISITSRSPQSETVALWINNVADTSFTFSNDFTLTKKDLPQGAYTLTLIANNSYNCKDTAETIVEVLPKPIAHLLYSYVSGNNASSTYVFSDSSQFHNSFALDFGTGIEHTGSPFTSYQKMFSDTGLFEIKLIAYQGSLCSDTVTLNLDVKTQILFYLPNAITPNSDGLNERFTLIPDAYIKELSLNFYNGWGEKVMEITSMENLKNQPKLPAGVYLVEGAILDTLNKRHSIKSTLTVLE